MKTFKLSQFADIAYDFEPSPLVSASRAAAFISQNSCIKVLVSDFYFRISLSVDLSPSGAKVYVAKLCRPRMRTGASFSNCSPDYLLQSVFDYIQKFDNK